MPFDGGPAAWPTPFLREIWLDGLTLQSFASLAWQQPAMPAALQMADGGHQEILLFRGGSAPLGLRPRSLTLVMPPISRDTELVKLTQAEAAGRSIALFPQLPVSDEFGAIEGQAQFSLSRFLAVGTVPGVTLTSHPVSATLDGVDQVITSSTPSAGQVQVIAGGALAQHRCVVTPPLSAGQLLVVTYYPLLYVRPQAQASYASHNEYSWTGTLQEVLLGDYS